MSDPELRKLRLRAERKFRDIDPVKLMSRPELFNINDISQRKTILMDNEAPNNKIAILEKKIIDLTATLNYHTKYKNQEEDVTKSDYRGISGKAVIKEGS